MRSLCLILVIICFTAINLSGAEEEETAGRRASQLIYEEGHLINRSGKDILDLAVVSPFYKYIGNIPKGEKINVSYIKNRFTVEYAISPWKGEYKIMKESFTPEFSAKGPDAGLDIEVKLNGDLLVVKAAAVEKINDIFIEVLSDIPIKISEDRTRYILSSVGVRGQNLKRGPQASFKIDLLIDQEFYKVPIQITYLFQGGVYDKVFFFSFRKEDFNNAP